MKTPALLLFLFITRTSLGNQIDQLKTNKDVLEFLVTVISKDFKKFPLLDSDPDDSVTAKYGQNKFFKQDIDQNNLTDIIISGTHLIAVLDKGNGKYELHYLDREFSSTKILSILAYSSTAPSRIILQQSKNDSAEIDTLVYRFENFIEYNPKPSIPIAFDKIIFTTDRCFGICPVFQITIDQDATAIYHAIEFNKVTGKFKGSIPKDDFADLVKLLEYLQIDNLKNDYRVEWTDDQTAILEIHYDGKTKIIRDYGKIGTFGLHALYMKFFHWRESVSWNKASNKL